MIETEKAYLAGLIDGEGYIGILKVKKGNKKHFSSSRDYLYCPIFKVCMTDETLIRWLVENYGGTFSARRRSVNPNWKDAFDWVHRNAKCLTLLKEIYPYLRIKNKEVDILIEFSKQNNGAGKPITDENWSIRDRLYSEIRKLHYRGDNTLRD